MTNGHSLIARSRPQSGRGRLQICQERGMGIVGEHLVAFVANYFQVPTVPIMATRARVTETLRNS